MISPLLLAFACHAQVPVIDELGYVAALRCERPEAFRNDCWNTVTLKPRYRAAMLSGTESYGDFVARSYDAEERAVDLAWMGRQQHALVTFCEAHPGSGGCGNICARSCDACPDAKLYGGADARQVRPAGYGLCGAVGWVVGEGPGGTPYDPDVGSWKVFFEFDDGYAEAVTPERYVEYFDRLAAAGYRGDAKMVSMTSEPQRVRYQYNNIMVHAWSPKDALIAERVGLELFAEDLAGHGRGLDVRDQDWHSFLCEDELGTLSKEALDYVGFGQAPALTPVAPLASYVREDLGAVVLWHPDIPGDLRARVTTALREDLASVTGSVRIAVSWGRKRGMGFHRSARWLLAHGYDAAREGVIEIFDGEDYLAARKERPTVLRGYVEMALERAR